MKSVLISIQPKWCEKIARGEKTIEVRKSRPKLETPFKVYIYCTKSKKHFLQSKDNMFFYCEESDFIGKHGAGLYQRLNGKVIGEFVCDRIDDFRCCSVPYKKENNLGYGRFVDNGVYKVNGWHEGVVFERNDRYIDSMLKNNGLKEMCLSAQEIFDYIGIGNHLYGWHITDLKIYDKPKELSEFYFQCEEYGKTGTIDTPKKCKKCKYQYTWDLVSKCRIDGLKPITRPPQSWCYVEAKE